MSWDQGIQLRKDLPERWVNYLEAKYKETFDKEGHLEYITWFGLDKEFFADFGNDNPALKVTLKDV